jgi:hypothetical protein
MQHSSAHFKSYVKSKSSAVEIGRKPVFIIKKEARLPTKILRLVEVGILLTTNVHRKYVHKFCDKNNISHQFDNIKVPSGSN